MDLLRLAVACYVAYGPWLAQLRALSFARLWRNLIGRPL